MKDVNIVFVGLQGKRTKLSEQAQAISGLVEQLMRLTGAETVLCHGDHTTSQMTDYIHCGAFCITIKAVSDFIQDTGRSAQELYKKVSTSDIEFVCRSFGQVVVDVLNGLSTIVAIRAHRNSPMEDVPKTTPVQLATMPHRHFLALVDSLSVKLRVAWDEDDLEALENEHDLLTQRYSHDPAFKKELDAHAPNSSFKSMWSPLEHQFPFMCQLAGGLSCVFPNTSTVESDFSILNWEMDEFRESLSDISLAGILHCKQFEELSSLKEPI